MKEPTLLARRPHFQGIPVPYVASWQGDIPDFKVIDEHKRMECITKRLCALCGTLIARSKRLAFIGGIRTRSSGMFYDAAMHIQCAEYAAIVCPFVSGAHRQYSKTLDHSEFLPGTLSDTMYLYITDGYYLRSDRYIQAYRSLQVQEIKQLV